MKYFLVFLLMIINLSANKHYDMKNCQYYDDFFDKCLFYENTYYNNSMSCTEECQHWDEDAKRCLYKTRCQKVKGGFIKYECQRFDDFFNKCKLERKTLLIDEDRSGSNGNINININR